MTACAAGKPAFADAYCGPWGGNDIRCLASHGITPSGVVRYHFKLSVKPEYQTNVFLKLVKYGSLCGISGFEESREGFRGSRERPLVGLSDEARLHPLLCEEFFVEQCQVPVGTPKPCGDVVTTTIREGDG